MLFLPEDGSLCTLTLKEASQGTDLDRGLSL